jgi:ABC-2 type transport system ATP-binding protein
MIFQLENVTKTYGNVTALKNLTVSAPRGAIGLLGPNGAGKTTMIRTLLGLISIDNGGGTVLGHDIRSHALDIRQKVGFVPENECLFPGVTGVDFVRFAGELCGMEFEDAMQRAHEVLDYTGVGEFRYRRVDGYSTGMKQRIKIASALVHDPQLLILDEPTNGMDPAGREEILALAHDLSHNKGMSLIFSSHLLPDVEYVCDHVLVMVRGQVISQGRIQELKRVHRQRYQVRLKESPDRFQTALRAAGCLVELREDLLEVQMNEGQDEALLWRLASELGQQIRYLRPQRSTLEEVFLSAVREDAQDVNLDGEGRKRAIEADRDQEGVISGERGASAP